MDGGELFDRIIDDNYNLTEFDTILFIKQICEGIRHMHQMYILHLDLKVEHALYPNLLSLWGLDDPVRYCTPPQEIDTVTRYIFRN